MLLPPHWQTAAVLLGCRSAGLAADLGGNPQPVEALFTTPHRVAAATAWPTVDRYATGLLPLAMPLREVPPGYVDYVDRGTQLRRPIPPGQPVGRDDRALRRPDRARATWP